MCEVIFEENSSAARRGGNLRQDWNWKEFVTCQTVANVELETLPLLSLKTSLYSKQKFSMIESVKIVDWFD